MQTREQIQRNAPGAAGGLAKWQKTLVWAGLSGKEQCSLLLEALQVCFLLLGIRYV